MYMCLHDKVGESLVLNSFTYLKIYLFIAKANTIANHILK